jgi:hypothetical protein
MNAGDPPGGGKQEEQRPRALTSTLSDTSILTFLIADIRGYTLFTQARGDEAAAKLAARFADVVRDLVEKRSGSVLELRGDEALCVFSSARQAIRASVDLQDRLLEETISDPNIPLPVGIGLDAGEAVPVEGGYRGGALNLAARPCGRAKAEFRCDGPGNVSHFCDPRLDDGMDRASELQLTDSASAAELWAEIDHDIVDQAPYDPLVNKLTVGLVSSRVQNFQYNPQ